MRFRNVTCLFNCTVFANLFVSQYSVLMNEKSYMYANCYNCYRTRNNIGDREIRCPRKWRISKSLL